MSNTEWIFLGIGGTSSWEYHTCWTHEMYKQFSGSRQNSLYLHGPDNSGIGWGRERNLMGAHKPYDVIRGPEAELGRSVNEIVNDATNWLMNRLKEVQRSNKTPKVALVGHSRGGFAVIQVARKLQYFDHKANIEFMGLFDAVKRTFVDEVPIFAMSAALRLLGQHRIAEKVIASHEQLPSNVKLVYHALRSWESRTWMGNTGRNLSSPDKTNYYEKKFNTSHGGLGGSAAISRVKQVGIMDDTSDYNIVYKSSHHPRHGATFEVDYFDPKLDRMIESQLVFHWIRLGAFSSGVPISGIQVDQRPLKNNDNRTMWT